MSEFKDFTKNSKRSREMKLSSNFIQSQKISAFERIQKSQKNVTDINRIIEFRDRNSDHNEK